MRCYEKDRGTTLHSFRSRLSFYDSKNYNDSYYNYKSEPETHSSGEPYNTSTSSTTINIEKEVKELLKKCPGLTGQEIASRLCIATLIIYNVLIEKLKDDCYKDIDNKWYLKTKETSNTANNTAKAIPLNQEILSTLVRNPGLKAKDIARLLNVDRSDVNKSLYGELKDKCYCDSSFRWNLKQNQNHSQDKPKESTSELAMHAYKNHLAINMVYKGITRKIYPYSVNGTYCVGFCTLRNDLRTFRLDKMKILNLGEEFKINKDFINRASSNIDNIKNYRSYY